MMIRYSKCQISERLLLQRDITFRIINLCWLKTTEIIDFKRKIHPKGQISSLDMY